VEIRCQCGGDLQKSLRQYDFNQLTETKEAIKTFDTEPWAQQLDL